MIKPLSALLAVALIAAAPPPVADDKPDDVVRVLHDQDVEVATIGYRLVTANAALCRQQIRESGVMVGTLAQYDAPYRTSAARVLGMTAAPTVALVVPGSPADRAGIKAGDVLIAAGATRFAAFPPKSARASFAPVAAAMAALDSALAGGNTDLTLQRGGQPIVIALAGEVACRARFDVAGDDLNATQTNSIWINVSPRLIDFAANSDGLAAVMAHELAHDVLGHRKGEGGTQRTKELQADRLMPWLMVRAGYEPAAAPALWRRFKAMPFEGFLADGSHPGWRERIAVVDAERARIAAIASRGGTIVPPDDLKPRQMLR